MKPPAPYGDRLFDNVRTAYDAHDDTCESLTWFWFGHTGGVCCPSDLESCEGCGVTFWLEGTAWVNWQDDDVDEIRLCGCCARGRGHSIVVDRHNGVRVADPADTTREDAT